MALFPAPGFLLIEILTDPKQTKEGIYLPDDLESEPMKAKVVVVGDERITETGSKIDSPTFDSYGEKAKSLEADDIIYFKKHTQQELPGYDEKKLAVIPFETVILLETE